MPVTIRTRNTEMSTGTEAPAGLSTGTGATGIRTQNLPEGGSEGTPERRRPLRPGAPRPNFLVGAGPTPTAGASTQVPLSPGSGADGSRRGSALEETRVVGPLSPAEGQGPGPLPSGNNDRSRALARASPARHGHRRRPFRSLRLRDPAAPPHRPPPPPARATPAPPPPASPGRSWRPPSRRLHHSARSPCCRM